jgi:hypothetical protein
LYPRVNAIGTEIEHQHEIVKRYPDGGFTVRYLEGPKAGFLINLFSDAELADLFSGWEQLLPPADSTDLEGTAQSRQLAAVGSYLAARLNSRGLRVHPWR